MRIFVAASILAFATAAHADSITADVTPAKQPNTQYVALGVAAGDDVGMGTAGGTLEIGYRVENSGLWVHGEIGAGATARLSDQGTGDFLQLRGGVETHLCMTPGFCMIPGIDLGIQRATFDGTEYPLFGDADDGMPVHVDTTVLVAIPRLQGDFGGSNLRVRPGIEAVIDTSGWSGVNATVAVAYRW